MQNLKRLKKLMDASLQILDHMIVDPSDAGKLRHIKEMMHEENRKLSNIYNKDTDQRSFSAATSMRQNIDEIIKVVDQFKGNLREDYRLSSQDIEQFEQLSIDEQSQKTEAYHDKIDYKSMVKLKENLNRINDELLRL
ncbi:hypothetical protein QNH23_03970 [Siminovitchia fortis]|uniref:Uncharacterized protein n=1 Tax=Siminovitchia fortis TaxID=254758 RepID=A0A443IK55_9BACI|nr:hypothetical protein [Siminovitchia fortis]RWR04916.1 hypothetical protein D4N35_016220 [Siminovitchia fortis]WHY82551.1 hypothetical protein QNH23_03970 [Siminovitchia fortis]